tara:strand:+ start:34442 stop:34930 length:489 start_codon:yes stop_codon:yes gene_type:complete
MVVAYSKNMRNAMIRETVKAAQIAAMKAGDKDRTAATRSILAKFKDKDIELRTKDDARDEDAILIDVLQKMAKQRRESIDMFESGGRAELAAAEQKELAVIEEFLPAQLSDAETAALIDGIKTELGADGMKDMGRVMGELKKRHGTEIDMSKASALVKAALS